MPSKTDINPATGKAYAINPSSGVWDDNYWASIEKTLPGYAQEKAQGALDAQKQAITDALIKQNNKFNDVVTTGRNDVTDFLTRYKTAVPDIVNNTQAKYNIPAQIGNVNALNSRIQELKGNLNNAGAGGVSNATQVDAALNSRYLPNFNTSVNNLNTSLGASQTEQIALTKPYEAEGSMLNDRLAREMSGFTTEQQNELSGLIEQLKAGVTLTTNQLDNANKLAIAQEGYQNQLDQLKQQGANMTAVQELKNQALKSIGKYGGAYMDENGVIHTVNNGASGTGSNNPAGI